MKTKVRKAKAKREGRTPAAKTGESTPNGGGGPQAGDAATLEMKGKGAPAADSSGQDPIGPEARKRLAELRERGCGSRVVLDVFVGQEDCEDHIAEWVMIGHNFPEIVCRVADLLASRLDGVRMVDAQGKSGWTPATGAAGRQAAANPPVESECNRVTTLAEVESILTTGYPSSDHSGPFSFRVPDGCGTSSDSVEKAFRKRFKGELTEPDLPHWAASLWDDFLEECALDTVDPGLALAACLAHYLDHKPLPRGVRQDWDYTRVFEETTNREEFFRTLILWLIESSVVCERRQADPPPEKKAPVDVSAKEVA